MRRFALAVIGLLPAAATLAGCFSIDVTEGPPETQPTRVVRVHIQYRQPEGCDNPEGTCSESVVFWGNWMIPGMEFPLQRTPGTFVWSGIAEGVPVNYPPFDQAWVVRVLDPHLRGTSSAGLAAQRLTVGGEFLTWVEDAFTPNEHALVYIDDAGTGHSP